MKKMLSGLSYWVLPVLLMCYGNVATTAQVKSSALKTQTREIVITISGIDYDDNDFQALRQALQNNVKAQFKNQTYAGRTAKINLLFNGSAAELWQQLPKPVKQPFKVQAIDAKSIRLQKAATSAASGSSVGIGGTDDCKTCTYFPICDLTDTRNFDGTQYRVFNAVNGKFYMHCSNGNLVQKRETNTGGVTGVTTQTIIKHNEPAGASWEESADMGAGAKRIYRFHIMAKGIPYNVNGKSYNDVMAIYHKVSTKTGASAEAVTVSEITYYAKGIGPVHKEKVPEHYDPVKKGKEMRNFAALYPTLKGSIDNAIVGSWTHNDKRKKVASRFTFNPDGTYRYDTGSATAGNQTPATSCYWRVNGSFLELLCRGWSKKQRLNFQKKKEAITGKPILVLQFGQKDFRTYYAEK